MSTTCKPILAVSAMALLLSVAYLPAQAEEDWSSHHAAIRYDAPWLEWTADDWDVWEALVWDEPDEYLTTGSEWTVVPPDGDGPQATYGPQEDASDAPYTYYNPSPDPGWYCYPPVIYDPWYAWWPEPYYGYDWGYGRYFEPDYGRDYRGRSDWDRDRRWNGDDRRWADRDRDDRFGRPGNWDRAGADRDGHPRLQTNIGHNGSQWNAGLGALGWKGWQNTAGGHPSRDSQFRPGQSVKALPHTGGFDSPYLADHPHLSDGTSHPAPNTSLPNGLSRDHASTWGAGAGSNHAAGTGATTFHSVPDPPHPHPSTTFAPVPSSTGNAGRTLGSWLDQGAHASTSTPGYSSSGGHGSHGWSGSGSSTRSYSPPAATATTQSHSGGSWGSRDDSSRSRYSAPSTSPTPRAVSAPPPSRPSSSGSSDSSRHPDSGDSGGRHHR